MKIKLILLQLVVLLLFSCEAPERNNPFDPACPKQIFTPTNFLAVQEGNTIKLTWSCPDVNFTGFRIFKTNNNGYAISLGEFSKDVKQFTDTNVLGGQQNNYSIYAYAGNNDSYSLNAQATAIFLPTISTTIPSDIHSNSATLGGAIATDGGAIVTERGVCYSQNPNPTINSTKVIIGNGIGSYSNTITGLSAETTYYVKAYATNSQGTIYGSEYVFTTKMRITFNPNLTYGSVTDVEGNVYKTITIGSQIWMAENLKTTKYNDNTLITNGSNNNSWNTIQSGLYCWPNNDGITYKDTYGALYNWYAVNSGKLCPYGWHIPSDAEWTILITYLGGETVGKDKLKEIGIEHWNAPNTNATNSSGFSAVPSGYKQGSFSPVGYYAVWWSSTEINAYDTICKWLDYLNNNSFTTYGARAHGNGFSVRCIKD
jgi:uncharacterized protein (TIGR02145 family)